MLSLDVGWHREKAGTLEHTHHILKNELAAGTLPSRKFGANAAWFRLNALTYNLLTALKRITTPSFWGCGTGFCRARLGLAGDSGQSPPIASARPLS